MSVVVAPDEVSLNTSCENVRLPSSAAHERHAPGPWPRLRLDTDYAASLATIPNGSRKRAGIRIGAAVTAAMLAKRANDGRFGTFTFTAGTAAGDWRPELPAMLSDAFAWVANVKPFAIRAARRVPHGRAAVADEREVRARVQRGQGTGRTQWQHTDRSTRIYLGFHFRTPDVQGAKLGRGVASYVADHFFERDDD